ncbi:MAG TPA: hypothetical protein VF824_20095 [Thermoanaerobaculia bacterium]
MIFAPDARTRLAERIVPRNRWLKIAAGDILRAGGRRLRVSRIVRAVTTHSDLVEHVAEIATRAANNLVAMPQSDHSMVAQFLRYHVLVRVYDGDVDAWLAQLRESGGDDGDIRFARWIRARLRHDPMLLDAIRRMVDETPFWRGSLRGA